MNVRIQLTLDQLFGKVKAAKKDWLYKAGAYLRKAARTSVKKGRTHSESIVNSFGRRQLVFKNQHSAPGEPPRDYNGWRRSFHFEVDNMAEIVVVGAIAGRRGIPPLHEYGGTGTVTWSEIDRAGRWHKRTISRRYPPRPVMGPAYEKSKKVISSFWKDAIK